MSGPRNDGLIYLRESSQNKSCSNSQDSSDELWDDRIFVNLYDKAVATVKEDVAKRLAMNTNSNKDSNKYIKNSVNKKNTKQKWKVGSECRAVYSEDGIEYEATIIYVDGDSCIVSYVGYNNEEEIKLKDLKPSLGKHERIQQTLNAGNVCSDNCGESSANESYIKDVEELQNNIKASRRSSAKSNKGKNKNVTSGHFVPPPLSSFQFPPMHNLDMNSHVPLPPPPPFLLPTDDDSFQDDNSLSAMLISWYMSGYYTGLYQGQRMKKKSK